MSMKKMFKLRLHFLTPFFAFIIVTCQNIEEEEYGTATFPLEAYCTVNVDGKGWLDVENDYLPHVIQCENGGAGLEALKAQAVAARSYMYYKMETAGHIGDGTGDQVYSCGRTPAPEHYEAVRATSGQVLMYHGVVVCAFYVAGADPGNRSTCVATSSDPDPTRTERYVTYNEGRSGNDVIQTSLGWVNPSNYRNRGCMSQWGSRCLEEAGYDYQRILRFYYGEDIIIETATGSCVVPPCASSDSTCDGNDDDCDGNIDEDYVPHSCGTGECTTMSSCSGGVEQCNPPSPPSSDDHVCDGRDEDCDGQIDEDYQPYQCGEGVCRAFSTCSNGVESCTPLVPEGGEELCNPSADAVTDGEVNSIDIIDVNDIRDSGVEANIFDGGEEREGRTNYIGLEGGCACKMML